MPSTESSQLHRRTPSAGDEDFVVQKNGDTAKEVPAAKTPPKRRAPPISLNSEPRSRVVSSPSAPLISPGPFRGTFGQQQQPASPLRTSFTGHSKGRSVTQGYSPPLHSPLAFSFPTNGSSNNGVPPTPPALQTSFSNPEGSAVPTHHQQQQSLPSAASVHNARRHARLHSRNLSVFFPQPGSLPATSTIDEDGGQELVLQPQRPAGRQQQTPRQPTTPLGANFKFGQRPPGSSDPPLMGSRNDGSSSASSTTSKRGHHHKHSMSHNFFSFLEPGGAQLDKKDLHTQPTPSPVSPWSDNDNSSASTAHSPETDKRRGVRMESDLDAETEQPPGAIALAFGQFVLGSCLWVSGQSVGSLSCTGLGYWVIFDSFGVCIDQLLPEYLRQNKSSQASQKARATYSDDRIKTVFSFTQAVFLMFAAVYVCKEAVEHILLSAGGEEGHHHHPGDEDPDSGIDFPILLIFISLACLIISAILFNTHAHLVNICGNRLPPPNEIMHTLTSPSTRPIHYLHPSSEKSPATTVLTNPFVLSPVFFCFALFFIVALIAPEHQRTADMVLAAVIAVVTFNVAYRACTVLGTVLLQTAPKRGLPGGKMETFLKAMRDIERHPQVLHLPAPHLWQVSPTPASSSSSSSTGLNRGGGRSGGGALELVVTMQLHVKHDTGDDDVLALTKWAWERCSGALGAGAVEVTVGVVRG